jgi:putative transcriptional regulator
MKTPTKKAMTSSQTQGKNGQTENAVNGGNTLLTVHRIVADLHRAGVLEKATLRKFDDLCLTPVESLESSEIRQLREAAGLSQSVLAKVLNVTTSTVGQWERGEKKPTGSALKLLALIRAKGLEAVL